jgi:endonuclease/exonuclease/phosphatase family metal-dependent hydrolase
MRTLIFTFLLCFPLLACAAEPAPTFRVLTYNIHHCAGTDDKIDIPRIANVIQSVHPDLVALQEVDVKTRRAGGVDQAAELARLTGLHPFFAKAMDYDGGEYGLLILSRQPLSQTAVHPLPNDSGREPRVLAEVHLRLGDISIAFLCTHLDHQSDLLRLKQVKQITDLAATLPEPLTLLAGDLNAKPTAKSIVSLLQHWTDATAPAPTFPSDKPNQKIDYILHRPAAPLKVVETQVLDEPVASDHRPVLAVFAVDAGK